MEQGAQAHMWVMRLIQAACLSQGNCLRSITCLTGCWKKTHPHAHNKAHPGNTAGGDGREGGREEGGISPFAVRQLVKQLVQPLHSLTG